MGFGRLGLIAAAIFLASSGAHAKNLVKPVSIQFVDVDNSTQTTSERTLIFNVKSCLETPEANKKITITGVSKAKKTLTTDSKGCVSWEDSLRHKVYSSEADLKKTITLASGDSQQNVDVLFDPLKLDKDFAIDQRVAPPRRLAQKKSFSPYITFPGLNLQLQTINYQVDDYLNLKLNRSYLLNVSPNVVAYDGKSATLSSLNRLRDGDYYLRVTLFKGVLAQPEQLLSGDVTLLDSHEQIVEVSGGNISTTVNFLTTDLISINARNTVTLELYPATTGKSKNLRSLADLKSGLDPRVYLGSIVPYNESSSTILTGSQQKPAAESQAVSLDISKIDALISSQRKLESEKQAKFKEISTPQAFAQEFALDLWSTNDEKFQKFQMDPKLFADLAENGLLKAGNSKDFKAKLAQQLVKLCKTAYVDNVGFWGNPKPIVTMKPVYQRAITEALKCQKDPLKYFSLDHKIHALKVEQVKWLGGKAQNLIINSSFDLVATNSLTASMTEAATISGTASFRPLALISTTLAKVPLLKDMFSASVDYSYSKTSAISDNVSEANSRSVSFTRGLALTEQEARFQIKISRYVPCVTISSNEQVLNQIFNFETPLWKPSGFHICAEEKTTPIFVMENYFFFSQFYNSYDFLDARDPNNRPFVMSLRGLRDYYVFVASNQGKISMQELKNNSTASSLDVLNKGLTIFTNQQRTYPGVYSSFATQEQLDFLLKTSTDEKTSPIINSLMQTLSPWTRQEIRALSSSK